MHDWQLTGYDRLRGEPLLTPSDEERMNCEEMDSAAMIALGDLIWEAQSMARASGQSGKVVTAAVACWAVNWLMQKAREPRQCANGAASSPASRCSGLVLGLDNAAPRWLDACVERWI